eukprot:11182451-Lingulodinium_polyedra.AAC.1
MATTANHGKGARLVAANARRRKPRAARAALGIGPKTLGVRWKYYTAAASLRLRSPRSPQKPALHVLDQQG